MRKNNPIQFLRKKDFKFIQEIGQGGTGRTILIEDEIINESFVCKKYSPFYEEDKEIYFQYFKSEIKILHSINHNNIVRVFNYYLYPEQTTGYILMEYIKGKSIDEYLFENPDRIVDVFNQTIEGFKYLDYRFQLLDCHNPSFKNILPIAVTGGKVDFTMFAVWANNPADKDGTYVTQVWKAINYYEELIRETKTILIGDLNSNTIWDKPRRQGNHTTVVNKLESKKIYSTYHKFYNQIQGKEEHPTLYLYRHENKPYHLDYCFASNDFIEVLNHVEIGTYHDWTMHSDHKPLIVNFNL